ncbi:rod shape-determining protein MreC [Patescibacteria group bacterium]|nr:rod shape-determining protein MreC [Patescibacteria group bacterium]MCL5010417.1 rod shape-determining protein MreC [Patescibacteria group bacterium]
MRERKNFAVSFLVLFFAAFILFVLRQWAPVMALDNLAVKILSPIGSSLIRTFTPPVGKSKASRLKEENRKLLEKLAKSELLVTENRALLDQFRTVYPAPRTLIPANVVSKPSFIPGETLPLKFILDKGLGSGVKKGQAVVVGNNLIGEIEEATDDFSVVTLITSHKFSQTAETSRSKALGVIKGNGSRSVVFGNILPSADIKKSDVVVSAGSLDKNGDGIPPNLVIGKVVSVNKNPSAIFQTCDVESLVDFSKLSLVFVIE